MSSSDLPFDPNDPFGGALPPAIQGGYGIAGERIVGDQRLFKIAKWMDTGFRYRFQLDLLHGRFEGSETARYMGLYCERADFAKRFPGMEPVDVVGRTIRITIDRDEPVIPDEEFTADALI